MQVNTKYKSRNILEQTCALWDRGQNRTDEERSQKTFTKLVLQEKCTNYKNALLILQLEHLDLVPLQTKACSMKTRSKDKYKIMHANTERFNVSPVQTMQIMLNRE